MRLVLLLLLGLLADSGLLVQRAIASVPNQELRRLPRKQSGGLAALSAIGWPGLGITWLISVAAGAIIFWDATRASYWLGAAIALLIGVEVLCGYAYLRPAHWRWYQANVYAAVMAGLLRFLSPLTEKLPKSQARANHSRLFETADLVDLLGRQSKQEDNRIDAADLAAAEAALKFNNRAVADVMVPLKDARIVLPGEAIGPHLMDELYASGHSAFPVGKKVGRKLPPELSGVVYLEDLVNSSVRGDVSRMRLEPLHFIDAKANLAEALQSFLKFHSSLLIVTNADEMPAAALWFEDVLGQLLGYKIKLESETAADADAREKMVE